MTGIYFQKLTDTHFQFVPYRGAGPAQQDLVAGQIDLMFDQAINAIPRVRAGQIKAYAVTSKVRLAAAPDIPTVMRRDCRGFIRRSGTGSGRRKARPRDHCQARFYRCRRPG